MLPAIKSQSKPIEPKESGVGQKPDSGPGRTEFIALMAALSALDAFSIDAMMPALEHIGVDLGIIVENHRQYIITALFLGFSVGVLAYGFVSDRYGRRGPVITGILIYTAASLMCIFADSMGIFLVGRALQGVGAAGPYVLAIAIVRDKYEGREMAKVMSLIMMVFIGVPMIAPFIGQGIMLLTDWRSIFIVLAVYGVLVMIWFSLRQTETLMPERRIPLSVGSIRHVFKEVLTHPQTVYYLMVLSAISGAFIAYLSTAQQVFQDFYSLGTQFPIIIAVLASTYGFACFLNSYFVQTLGMARLVRFSLISIMLSSMIYACVIVLFASIPSLWIHLVYMGLVIFWFGFLFENIITLALEPMSHIAGSATSIITSVSTLIAIALSTLIGAFLTDSALPIVVGFLILAGIAWWICLAAEKMRSQACQ